MRGKNQHSEKTTSRDLADLRWGVSRVMWHFPRKFRLTGGQMSFEDKFRFANHLPRTSSCARMIAFLDTTADKCSRRWAISAASQSYIHCFRRSRNPLTTPGRGFAGERSDPEVVSRVAESDPESCGAG